MTKMDERGFGLGLLALVIVVLIAAIIYSRVAEIYLGKSARQKEQVRNGLGDANVSASSSVSDNYEGLLSSIKSRINASQQQEADRNKAYSAY